MNQTSKTSLFKGKDGMNYLVPFILVTCLFFFWGVANNMTDTLLAAFKNIMKMNDFQTSFIQMAFYGSYACFAIPAALLIRKYNFKTGIIFGLILYAAGTFLFYPASQFGSYAFYLFAIYIMAGGCSILETTANPYILSMGSPETATRRLNFAQSFNPIGSITGIALSQYFILSQLSANKNQMDAQQLQAAQTHELFAVTTTYMCVGITLLVLLIIILSYKNMPKGSDTDKTSFIQTMKSLAKRKNYTAGVIAQFFYVGAQIGVWSYTIRYVMKTLGMVDPITDAIIPAKVTGFIQNYPLWSDLWNFGPQTTAENIGNSFFLASVVLFMCSRFIFTALMKYLQPGLLLAFAAFCAVGATLVSIFGYGMTGVIGLVIISFFMSLMFPTIYGLALNGLHGGEAKVGGSFLVMAILGGALMTTMQGYVSTTGGDIRASYWVPLIGFAVVALYGLLTHNLEKPVHDK